MFTLHHCAMNRGCGGRASSYIIVCYGCVTGEAIYPSMCFYIQTVLGQAQRF